MKTDPLLGIGMRSRFGNLFVSLVLVMFLPYFLPDTVTKVGIPLLFTVVMLTALAAVADTRVQRMIGAALAVPALLFAWLDLVPGDLTTYLRLVFTLAFLLYVAKAIFSYILHAREVDASTIFAAISVYFLLAYIWSVAYGLLELANPGSISVTALGAQTSFDAIASSGYLTYFSFVTLTTLGYGDVTPATDFARVLAVTEAALGQLFLVVLVARLVGLHTSQDYAEYRAEKAKRTEESDPG
jgi:voltage-gated potassium channel Kch